MEPVIFEEHPQLDRPVLITAFRGWNDAGESATEAASFLKLLLYISVIACVFFPWGIAVSGQGPAAYLGAIVVYVVKLAGAGFLLAIFETAIAKMRVFRVSDFLGAALMLGFLAALLLFVSRVA